MKKYLALAAVLVLAGCGKKEQAAPAADTTAAPAAAPATTDSAGTMDSTMTRDSAHSM